MLIINIFHSKIVTFCFYLSKPEYNKTFSMIKWKETPFHRLCISLTLNLFRSIHYSKWWIWKTWSNISIVCFLERQFLGEILFPWNLMSMCTQVIHIKHISYELSLDGCRMSIVIISYKTSLDAQHLSAPGRLMLCICIFPLSIIRASHI